MGTERIPERRWAVNLFRALLIIVALMVAAPVLAQDEGEKALEGKVDLVYRSVRTDGSQEKFDEDFDGLDSGARIGELSLNWQQNTSDFIDYARLNLYGLGGEPFESSSFQMGRKDAYKLEVHHRKQSYLYNLFSVTDDEDGHSWDTDNRMTDFDLSMYPSDNMELMFGFHRGRRTGNSLYMKDIERELFRLETPIDRDLRRYNAGVRFKVGSTRILFRQSLQRYEDQFNNHTEFDAGLGGAGSVTFLDSYAWNQEDDGTSHLTDLLVTSLMGDRVSLSFSYFGTLFGKEELSNSVNYNASGLDYNGLPFTITNAFNEVDMERETNLFNVDLGVKITRPVTLHLQYRKLDRETIGEGTQDLDGDTVIDPVSTHLDQTLDVATALVEYRPMKALSVEAGYRTIDRTLDRDGFGSAERDEDFDSSGDNTVLLGFNWKPVKWFKMSGEHEDGEVDQMFTEVSLFETKRTRVRTSLRPVDEVQVDLSYTDFENRNDALTYGSRAEGTTQSISLWHQASPRISYFLTYSQLKSDTAAEILFDTASYTPCTADPSACEDGDTLFDTDSSSLLAQLNVEFTNAWKGFFRYSMSDADGDNVFFGDVSGVISAGVISQDYTNWEAGLTHYLASGLFVGGSIRAFDYQDVNDLLDYDGIVLTGRAGFTF